MPHTHVGLKTVNVSPQWAGTHNYSWVMSGDGNGSWVTAQAQTDSNGNPTDIWDFTVQDNYSGQRVATCTVLHNNGVTSDSFTITQIAGTGGSSPTTTTAATTTAAPATTTAAPAESYTNMTVVGGSSGTAADETGSGANRRVTFTITGNNIPDGTTINITSLLQTQPTPGSATTDDFAVNNVAGNMVSSTASGVIDASELNPFTFVNNVAEKHITTEQDYTTEGAETFQITLANTSSTGVAHGLGPTFTFVINDTSVYSPIELYNNNSGAPNLLGSSTSSTSGNVTLHTYTWDNNTNVTGPTQSIIFNGVIFSGGSVVNDIGSQMTLSSGSGGNMVNTPGGVYWSDNADGSTDDTYAISEVVGTGVINGLSLSGSNANNGLITGDGTINWTDGEPQPGTTTIGPLTTGESFIISG